MANNTLIGLTNLIASATLKNGTGGGAPARDETSPYVMEKLQSSDRYTVWASSAAPPTPLDIDFDLGSNKTITAFAILGLRVPSGTVLGTISVYTQPSSAGYPPAGWTNQGTLSALTRDSVVIINSISARYVRLEFSVPTGPFTLAKFWVGNPTDLGVYHSLDAVYGLSRNRLETQLPGGAYALTDLGDPGGRYALPFHSIDSTLKGTLKALRDQAGTFVIIDPEGTCHEVFIRGGVVEPSRRFNNLWDVDLDLVVCP